MRILICTSELPFKPITGTRLTLIETAWRLSVNHDVTIVGYRWPEQQGNTLPDTVRVYELAAPTHTRVKRLAYWLLGFRSSAPLQSAGLVRPMARIVTEVIAQERFDIAHVTASPLAGIAPALGTVPKILVALDAWNLNAKSQTTLSPPHLRPIRRLEERRIERFSRRSFTAFDTVVTVSQEDKVELERLGVDTEIRVVPNGVDTEAFYPSSRPRDHDLIVFVGTMRWSPNIVAARFLCENILPRVRRVRPDAKVAIVGRAVDPALRASLSSHPGVRVVGEVEDVGEWLRRAAVFCCPMLDGTGIKNKLLEAFACGAPTVATPLACQGVHVVDGQQLIVAEGPDDMAGAVVQLLEDESLAAQVGDGGRAYVEQFHRWDAVTASYVSIYQDAAMRHLSQMVA